MLISSLHNNLTNKFNEGILVLIGKQSQKQ